MPDAPTIAPLDAQTAYDLLAAVVEEAGRDHVYVVPSARDDDGFEQGCKYVEGDNPSCIVGRALAAHGVPLDVMRKWDAGSGLGITSVPASDVHPWMTPDALCLLREAQRVQDRVLQGDTMQPHTWGDALDAAAETLADPR